MSEFPMSGPGWQQGLTLEAYVDQMQHHQAATRRRLAQIGLRPADVAAFAAHRAVRHVLVMTEDWCGDSMLTVPILAHLLEAAAATVDLRFFPRAQSPELEAYYRARDITHIPVFAFLDAYFHPLATWVERPRLAHERLADWYGAHPEVTAVRNDASLDPETRRERLRPLTAGLLDEMEGWYNHGVQQAMVDEITRLFQTENL
jgi:hypothetical protein